MALTIFSVNNKTKVEVVNDPHKKQTFSYNPQISAYIHYNLKNTSSKGPIYMAILTVRQNFALFHERHVVFFYITYRRFEKLLCALCPNMDLLSNLFLATGYPP